MGYHTRLMFTRITIVMALVGAAVAGSVVS